MNKFKQIVELCRRSADILLICDNNIEAYHESFELN